MADYRRHGFSSTGRVRPAPPGAAPGMLISPFPSHDDRRSAHQVFGSAVTAPRRARAFVRCQLGRWELGHVTDTAELLVSELVTNAVQATDAVAGSPFASSMFPVVLRMVALRLRVAPGRRLCIEVWDVSEREPVARDGEALDEGGRGLALVDSLAASWGHYTAADRGKIVWCELPIPGAPARVPGFPGGDVLADVPARRHGDVRPGHVVAEVVPLPRRARRHPRAERVEGPDRATLLRVLRGLRELDVSDRR
ncbi:ATP-binding protein [Microbispora sp. NPDC049125]|uniref:ATP-binding protein n=1 Tax=Microbispora sp. NPDC049125 TaxID=3154929 RepID=UPI0034676507